MQRETKKEEKKIGLHRGFIRQAQNEFFIGKKESRGAALRAGWSISCMVSIVFCCVPLFLFLMPITAYGAFQVFRVSEAEWIQLNGETDFMKKKPKKQKRYVISIDPKIHRELKKVSKQDGVKLQRIVQDVLTGTRQPIQEKP